MSRTTKELLAFNRGVISPRGLARIDIERMAMSAEIQRNWIPRVLGSMMLRPGLKFIDRINSDATSAGRQVPFTFGVDDTAALELSPGIVRVRINDVLITKTSISTLIANSAFTTSVPDANWTDNSEAGGVVGHASGHALINGNGANFGIMRQSVSVAGPDQNSEHFLNVVISDGPVRLKVGSTAGDDDYVAEVRLERGNSVLAFTPTGASFVVEFANEREFNARINQCTVVTGAVPLAIGTPWAAAADYDLLRWAQSGDVIYFANNNDRLTKIERRGVGRSWGVVQYLPENGPFRVQNVSGNTITPSALNGEITLTARTPLFKQSHADNRTLFRIASAGQTVTVSAGAADVFTDPIRVVGSETARVFSLIIENRVDSTITLQFAFSADGPWNDTAPQYTADISTSYDDGQDGQIIYYRLGIKTGDYGTDTVICTLNYTGGSIEGVARVNAFTSSTVVSAQVLKDFGAITASKDWWEGEWSDRRGYPSSVALHEGRLFLAGRDKIFGSVSDGYEDFGDATEGDSGPISRSIGSGPIRVIHWLMSMGRLLLGTSENSSNVAAAQYDGNNPLGVRSNSFDEPLTPTNFNIKTISSKGLFVDRTKQRLYELAYNLDEQDYRSLDLSVFTPDFNVVGITRIAVQMKPDIRIHCVRTDGTVGILVYDRLENVICWMDVDSPGAGGLIEDVSVLPGLVEDQVYYIVKRTINGGTQRHLCKWALESEAVGGLLNKQADSFVEYDGAATVTPFTTELLHLRDETVVVWADGVDVGTHTVSATGGITLTVAAAKVVAGLGYTAQFKSAKLGEINGLGLLDRKNVQRLGFIAENLHYQGLQYGPDFTELSDLPLVEDGDVTPANTVYAEYHEDDFAFGGEWDTDSRICLQAAAPRPCTILAALAEMESVERPRRTR